MASEISIDKQYFWVANRRLSTLITFALEVAPHDALTTEEKGYVAKFKKWDETEHWPGCCFDLNERFPTVDEKKFWSRCFLNVARQVFDREIGDQSVQSWQCGVIGDAHLIARMLTSAVQKETGDSWQPVTKDAADAQENYSDINIQI